MPKEFDIINYFRNQNCGDGQYIERGPGDDMAVMNFAGQRVLVTTDMLLDGVHFDSDTTSLERIGYKSMAVSLSDCAAMCSRPIAAVGALSLPRNFNMAQIAELHAGLKKAAVSYNCPIIGGDLTSWDNPLTVTVTMFSIMENNRQPVYRSGAKVGDKIMVTGKLGGSIWGHHLDFTPRVREAIWLYDHSNLHAMMDLSDGIGGDLRHICHESGVSACLYPDCIPVSDVVTGNSAEQILHALTDGEDFELLFTVSDSDAESLLKQWSSFSDEKLSVIGEIIAREPHEIYLKAENKLQPFHKSGYEH